MFLADILLHTYIDTVSMYILSTYIHAVSMLCHTHTHTHTINTGLDACLLCSARGAVSAAGDQREVSEYAESALLMEASPRAIHPFHQCDLIHAELSSMTGRDSCVSPPFAIHENRH